MMTGRVVGFVGFVLFVSGRVLSKPELRVPGSH
jgi:hypothetical protein